MVMVSSVNSLTYKLGARQVTVLSQGMKNFTLLRLVVVELFGLPEVGLEGSGLVPSL